MNKPNDSEWFKSGASFVYAVQEGISGDVWLHVVVKFGCDVLVFSSLVYIYFFNGNLKSKVYFYSEYIYFFKVIS